MAPTIAAARWRCWRRSKSRRCAERSLRRRLGSRASSPALLRQRLRRAHLRAGLVPSRPACGRRVIDLDGRAAVELHGRDGAGQRAAATTGRQRSTSPSGRSPRSKLESACSGSSFRWHCRSCATPTSRLPVTATPTCCCGRLSAPIVLLPPTVLMGATLPAIARWTSGPRHKSGAIGFLYMANIAGAAFGTALAGFYLLRVFDTVIASGIAVAINGVVALTALALARRLAHHVATDSPVQPAAP